MPWPQALARASKEWNREYEYSQCPDRGPSHASRTRTPRRPVSLHEAVPARISSSHAERRRDKSRRRDAKHEAASRHADTGVATKKPSAKNAQAATGKKEEKKVKKESSSDYEEVTEEEKSSDSSESSSSDKKKKDGKSQKVQEDKKKSQAKQVTQDKKPQPKQICLPKAKAKQSSHDAMAQLFEAQAAVMRSLAPP